MQIQNALLTGSTTVYGPITFVSGSIIGSSSYAATSSYADTFTVAGSLTAQTLVVQTITSSISFITGSTRFGSLQTNTHTFTGSLQVTASTINLSNSKIIIGDDGTYAGNISTVGFGGTTNGFNRIAAANNTTDGIYLIAATGRGIYFRPGGKSTQDLSVFPNGNTALGVNFLLPTATLHISGSGSGSLMQISSTVSSSIFFVSGSGNVGIGTTSPTAKLDIRSHGLDTNVFSIYGTTGGAKMFNFRDDNAGGVTAAMFSMYNSSGTETVRLFPGTSTTHHSWILPSGSFGIGTTSPQSILHAVKSNSTAPTSGTTPSGYALSYGVGDGNNGGIWFSTDFGGDQGIAGIAGTRVSGYQTDLRFYTNDTNSARAFTERMRITSGGNVQIGNDSNPFLYIANGGSTDVTSGINWLYGSGLVNGGGIEMAAPSGNNFYMVFKTRNAGSTAERMRITSAGRVGIGTTSPDTKLHIYDGTNPLSLKIQRTTVPVFFSDVQTAGTTAGAVWSHNIENTSNGSFTWSGLTNTSYAGSAIMLNSDTSNSYITFHTSGSPNTTPTERMRIKGDGGVSIVGPYVSMDGSGPASFSTPPSGIGYGIFPYSGVGLGLASVANGIGFFIGTTTERMRVTATATHPVADNAYTLGASGIRWSAVWAANGTIQTSDEREKKDIVDSDLGLEFVTKLRPVSFKWKIGQNIVTSEVIKDEEGNPILDENGKEKEESVVTPREGTRTHYGLIAQEVESLLNGKDFGGFIHDTETDIKGLRYDQFVPVLVKSIQELSTKLDEATTRIKTLESR
jgi:hypothetical protein